MSGVFFNGRKITTPATASRVDDTALANRNLTVGNVLAIIGRSLGGQPGTALRFGNPVDARDALRGGDLLTAVEKAFDPSADTPAPSEVVVVRVNPAVQAALALKDALAADVIQLKSQDFGLYTNGVKVKIEAGSVQGKRLTTQLAEQVFTEDNVARRAFSIQYVGAEATAVMAISGTTVSLNAPAATPVASIDLATYKSVQELVDRINSVPGFSAAVLDGNGEKATLNALDYVAAQDVKTAMYTARADLQAIVDWFNGVAEPIVSATRAANAGTLPVNIPFTYLAGGSDGVVTSQQWADALTALQSESVQWIVPVTSDASIHAQVDAHCTFMSTVGRKERRAVVGLAQGQTKAQALAAALALNSDRTSVVYPGHYDFDADGELVLYPPFITAALVGAAFAGSDPGTPLTNKSIKIRGLEYKLRNPTDTDELIEGGVLCLEETTTGYRIVKSITTWLTNDNYNRVEVSTGVALDFVSRNVREALDVLRGERGSPQVLGRAKAIVESTLTALAQPVPQGPGVLVGDADNPAFRNILCSLDGDVLRVQFQCSPVIPINYTLVTIFAVPFSATVTG